MAARPWLTRGHYFIRRPVMDDDVLTDRDTVDYDELWIA